MSLLGLGGRWFHVESQVAGYWSSPGRGHGDFRARQGPFSVRFSVPGRG